MFVYHIRSVIAPYTIHDTSSAIVARDDGDDHAFTPQVDGMRHAASAASVIAALHTEALCSAVAEPAARHGVHGSNV